MMINIVDLVSGDVEFGTATQKNLLEQKCGSWRGKIFSGEIRFGRRDEFMQQQLFIIYLLFIIYFYNYFFIYCLWSTIIF